MLTKLNCLFVFAFLFFAFTSEAQTAPEAQSVTGKVICGYQGWFNCYGDGSPVARWFHWSRGQYQSNNGYPAPGHLNFEAYPDVSEYTPSSLFQTGFANTGEGNASKLFSSYKADVIDRHFLWMEQNGIDGIALQRFISETFDGVFKANRDSVAARVKRSAENHHRIFYMMYDISGLNDTKFDSLKTDWEHNMVAKLHLTSSPYYVHQNNKPVVCLWGFGFTDRPGTAAQCLNVINWFKSKGCFVIGGVPTNWRTSSGDSKPGFTDVYKAYDMISPWSVGRFGNSTEVDNFRTNYLQPDLAYCNTNNLLYQPVIFPGFAWSNWNGGNQNQMPRNKGEFMWRQVYNIKQSGIGNMYVAMFDEYDEGTAIAKMADSYYAIPSNQYFLTTSADGTYISPDFYLRLIGKATKVIKGTDPITTNVTIPFSNGPIWFRSGFEQKFDAMPTWVDSQDPSFAAVNVVGYGGGPNLECGVVSETNHIGSYSLRYAARDNSSLESNFYFRVVDVDIPVNNNTKLSFWTYPQNALARYVSVDLVMTDGTTLRSSGATDTTGLSMHPNIGRGTINTWNRTVSNIGQWLNGKTIDRILIGYDHAAETGDFRGFVDDIAVYQNVTDVLSIKLQQFQGSVQNQSAKLSWTTQNGANAASIILERSLDGSAFSSLAKFEATGSLNSSSYNYIDNTLLTASSQVFYRLKFINKDGSYSYSKVLTISFKEAIAQLTLLPNPAASYVQLNISSKNQALTNIKIIDASGKVVMSKHATIVKGLNALTIDGLSTLQRGMYVVQLNIDAKTVSAPLSLLHY